MRTSVFSVILAAIIPSTSSAALNAANVFRADSPFAANFPMEGHLRVDGTLLDAVNLGAPDGSPITSGSVPNVTFAAAQGPNPSGANWSTVAPNVESNLEGDPRIDALFFSEILGPDLVSLTYRNLDSTRRYVVQIGHGEPRGAFAGRFSNNDFVLGNGTVLPVPSFQLGNNIAREDPPAADDLALVTVEITNVSSFTYNMRDAEGAARGPSIALFQVRDITAATRVVTTVADSGAGSLRQALADAAKGDTVVFSPAVFDGEAADTIVLASQLDVIGASVTVDAGNIPGGVTVSGNDAVRVFQVRRNFTLRGLSVVNGRGGINILADGWATAERYTFVGNRVAVYGAGYPGANSKFRAFNCTFTGNKGRTIVAEAGSAMELHHCTLVGNTATQSGGGLYVGGRANVTVANCVIAGNTAPTRSDISRDPHPAIPGDINLIVLGNNIIGDNDGVAGFFPIGNPNANGDYVGVTHGLNVFADNGGPGQTFLPLPVSAALDHGERLAGSSGPVGLYPLVGPAAGSPGLDQRGQRRSATTPDIGAVEMDWAGGSRATPPAGAGNFGIATTLLDSVTASSNNSAPSEGVYSGIDNDYTTKYRNFDRLNTGFDLTPSIGPTRLVALVLTSAASSTIGRNPATFVILGAKAPGSGFEPVASGVVPAFTGGFMEQTLYFPAVTASHAHYRIIFPTVASVTVTSLNDSMEIANVWLLGRATDPTLRITKFQLNSTRTIYGLVFVSEPNATYRLRSSLDLETWTNASTGISSGGAATQFWFNSAEPAINLRLEKE